MFWFYLIGGAVTLFWLYRAFIEYRDMRMLNGWSVIPNKSDYVMITVMGLFMWGVSMIVGLLIAFLINGFMFNFFDEEYETYNPLVSGGDSNGTNGHFSVFGGSIENQPVYMYYLQNDRGEFRLYHIDSDEAYITYTDESPKIVYHKKRSTNDFWAIDTGSNNVRSYEFRVPSGSVKQGFNYDAQ